MLINMSTSTAMNPSTDQTNIEEEKQSDSN